MDRKIIEKIVEEVWYELYRRKGFDNLWDSIDKVLQEEIKFAMYLRAKSVIDTHFRYLENLNDLPAIERFKLMYGGWVVIPNDTQTVSVDGSREPPSE